MVISEEEKLILTGEDIGNLLIEWDEFKSSYLFKTPDCYINFIEDFIKNNPFLKVEKKGITTAKEDVEQAFLILKYFDDYGFNEYNDYSGEFEKAYKYLKDALEKMRNEETPL
jgi:hypothetical protein